MLFIATFILVVAVIWLETRSPLYFAYGANTNTRYFHERAPSAKIQSNAVLANYEAVMLEHMNVTPKEDSQVKGVLWTVSKKDLRELDKVEEDYDRIRVKVQNGKRTVWAEMYVMKRAEPKKPSSEYVAMVRQGYEENGLPTKQIEVPPPLQG